MAFITRGEFLAKLAKVAIIAPIAPKLLGSVAATIDALTSLSITPVDSPKLTLAMLEEAYQVCTYGYEEPDLILMAPDIYSEFMSMWVTIPDATRYLKADGDQSDVTCPYFNGAAVTFAKALPRGSWICINSNDNARREAMKKGWIHPDIQAKLSGYFTKVDIKWHPIPNEI